jgi:hypothetical protein
MRNMIEARQVFHEASAMLPSKVNRTVLNRFYFRASLSFHLPPGGQEFRLRAIRRHCRSIGMTQIKFSQKQ